jgi:drug/metabolite transporter (DMT)-like permease
MTHSSHYRTGLICAALGAIAFSGKAIIVKLGYRYGVDAITLLVYRMLFALPFLLLLAWWSGRGKPALTRTDWLGILGLGFIGYYLSSLLDFMGLQYISASLERLILYLNPTLVLIFGVLFYRKRVSSVQAIAMLVSYGGVLVVFGHELSLAGAHVALGSALVFLSATTYAIYLGYSGQIVQRIGSLRLAGLATSAACCFCLIHFVSIKPLSGFAVSGSVLWLSLLNATLCTVVPVLLVMLAIERIGAALTAQVGMIGPIATIAMSTLILGEPFTPWVMAGTVLVVLGVYLVTKFGNSKKEQTNVKSSLN